MSANWERKLNDLIVKYSADIGLIYQLNPKDNHLYLVANKTNFPEDKLEIMKKIPMGKGIAGETALTKKAIVSSNLTGNEAPACARPLAKMLGIMGMISVPILHGENVVGTIGLGYYSEREFTQEEINELIKIGNSFAEEMMVTE